jgi:glycosyltransferase involved in cell wall biosynthesis
MNKRLVVFDSHPVQYRVPVWRAMEAAAPGAVHVVYASDCSVKGHMDGGFGQMVAWDDPMMEGYTHSILNCEKGKPLSGWGSLTGKGVGTKLDELKPDAVLLTGFNYRYDGVACLAAMRRGIPVWLRCENQDHAMVRNRKKALVRSLIYRGAYRFINKAFYIGKLNKSHYLKHGISEANLFPAHYATVDRFASMSREEKQELRQRQRTKAGGDEKNFVVGFSGKFISKKNPDLLFQMLDHLDKSLRSRIFLYFLGSGKREVILQKLAADVLSKYGVKAYFAGFVNQSELASHYLAMDLLVLPSRRMGETWGLVANESMQAGCAVTVSSAVGSGADFGSWEQFRVANEGDPVDLARAVGELAVFPRSFDWALKGLEDYSIEATADALLAALGQLG